MQVSYPFHKDESIIIIIFLKLGDTFDEFPKGKIERFNPGSKAIEELEPAPHNRRCSSTKGRTFKPCSSCKPTVCRAMSMILIKSKGMPNASIQLFLQVERPAGSKPREFFRYSTNYVEEWTQTFFVLLSLKVIHYNFKLHPKLPFLVFFKWKKSEVWASPPFFLSWWQKCLFCSPNLILFSKGKIKKLKVKDIYFFNLIFFKLFSF